METKVVCYCFKTLKKLYQQPLLVYKGCHLVYAKYKKTVPETPNKKPPNKCQGALS